MVAQLDNVMGHLITLKTPTFKIFLTVSLISNLASMLYISAARYYHILSILAAIIFCVKYYFGCDSFRSVLKFRQQIFIFYVPLTCLLVGESFLQIVLHYVGIESCLTPLQKDLSRKTDEFMALLQQLSFFTRIQLPTNMDEWEPYEHEEYQQCLTQAQIDKCNLHAAIDKYFGNCVALKRKYMRFVTNFPDYDLSALYFLRFLTVYLDFKSSLASDSSQATPYRLIFIGFCVDVERYLTTNRQFTNFLPYDAFRETMGWAIEALKEPTSIHKFLNSFKYIFSSCLNDLATLKPAFKGTATAILVHQAALVPPASHFESLLSDLANFT